MTGSYNVAIKKSAERELRFVPSADLRRITDRIATLAHNPRPAGSEKLSAQEQYRVRQGDYRIVYTVDDEHLSVEIIKIGHRREVYR